MKTALRRRWRFGAVIGALAWLAPAIAHADPVTATIAAFVNVIAGAAAAAAVGNFLLVYGTLIYTTAGSWALSKLSAPKGASSSQERQAQVTALTVGEVPREMIVGMAGTGGSLADAYYYGGQYGTDWNTFVIALADHRCDALVGFYVGDTYVPFTGDGQVAGYNGQLTVYWRPGAADDAPFPGDIAGLGPATAAGSLKGVARVAVSYKADAPDAKNPIWTSGRPTFLWVVKGARCYDPRKDDTVPGGAGPHRWDDPATWEWSENAEICRYAFARGVYALDAVDNPAALRLGRGLSVYEAPPERVFAAANLCDELVDLGDGKSEPRYRVGGVIKASETFDRVEQMFADATGGYIIQPEGGVAVDPGQARTPVTVQPITDADLLAGVEASFSYFRSASDRVNTVVPRYVEPSQKWADTAATVCRDLADIAADGGPAEETLGLSLVPFRAQAERVGEMRRRQHRLERTATIQLGPRFAHLEEGDWIEWASERFTKGETVVFRITAYALDGAWRNTLALEETSYDVYGFGGLPSDPTPGEPSVPPGALALAGVTVDTILLQGDNDSLVPAVQAGWTAPVDPGVLTIRVEVRLQGQSGVAPTSTSEVNAGQLVVTNGVPPAARIEVRLVPLGAPGRAIVPSNWISLLTGGLVADQAIVAKGVEKIAGLTPAELYDELRAASEAGRSSSRAILDLAMSAIDERAQLISETFHKGVRVKRILIDDDQEWEEGDKTFWSRMNLIALLAPDGESMIMRSDTLMWSPTESLAHHVNAVETRIGDDIASATTSIKAWVNSSSAGVLWINNLELHYGNNFVGSITETSSIVAGIGGTVTNVININGHISGTRHVNTGVTSSLVFAASEIGFANGFGDVVYNFSVIGGVTRATNFEADRVKANSITVGSIVANSITYYHIQNGNVLNGHLGSYEVTNGASFGGGYVSLSVGSWAVLASGNYSTQGQKLVLWSQPQMQATGSDTYPTFRLKVDGVEVDNWSTFMRGGTVDSNCRRSPTKPGYGYHSFVLEGTLEPGSGPANSIFSLLDVEDFRTER